jgi:protein-S-isoprenylcysteine O-methyltransferase Ste14
MAFFAFWALSRWNSYGNLYFLLLFFRGMLCAFFLLRRNESTAEHSWGATALAWASSCMPFVYLRGVTGLIGSSSQLWANLLAILGFTIATVALIDLGTSFGFAPAVRSARVETGLYRLTRHPMYLGYAVAELGWVLVNPINLAIYLVSCALFFLRARLEDALFVAVKNEA